MSNPSSSYSPESGAKTAAQRRSLAGRRAHRQGKRAAANPLARAFHLVAIVLPLLTAIALLAPAAAFLTATSGVPAYAQTTAEKSANEDLRTQTDFLTQTLALLQRISASDDLDDEELVGASAKYQSLLSSANELIKTIDTQLATINQRLSEIGDAPQDPAAEAPEVTQTRDRLTAQKTELAVIKTKLEDVAKASTAAIQSISSRRQELFSEAIFKRTPITMDLLGQALASASDEAASAYVLFKNWFQYVLREKMWQAIGSTLLSAALAIFLSFNFRRYFGRFVDRDELQPDYFNRFFTAFFATILPSAAIAIFLAATYGLFLNYSIFSPKVQRITFSLFIILGGSVFAWNFARAIFAPWRPNWRLIPVDDRAAKWLFRLVFGLYLIQGLDYFLDTVNNQVIGSIPLTVAQGLAAAFLIGAILMLVALVRPKNIGHPEGPENWPRWASIPMIFIGAAIIIVSLMGYVGLGRFIAQQVVVTGAIISTMIIGFISANQLSKPGMLPTTLAGRFIHLRMGMPVEKLDQLGLVASMLFVLIIVLIGIPAIFLQWGTRLEEVMNFFASLFTGIDIAGFRLSLTSILIGLAVFVTVLVVTRLIQGWLRTSVFPRSKVDAGIQDSIRAGVGYLGVALAAIFGIVSAGIDLSSLAIVAGALSLGIGFGLQNIVSNFVSGLILLVERPIKVGDWIVVGNAQGIVKRISVRATEVETFQRQSIIVPNSELINTQVGNWTFKSKMGRVEIPIGVAYGTDVRLVERILYEIAEAHAMVSKKPEPIVYFANFGASSLDFELRVYLADIGNSLTVQTEIRFEMLRRFTEAGIEIPFTQTDLNFRFAPGTGLEKGIGQISVTSAQATPAKPARKRATTPRKTVPRARRRNKTGPEDTT